MATKYIVISTLLGLNHAKICWKECGNENVIEVIKFVDEIKHKMWNIVSLQSADIIGCHRRSTYPYRQDFTCDGTVGPPCFVERGDTVFLDVNWFNPGVANMTQSTVWVTWIEMPWVGMETEACPYLDGGNGCKPNALVSWSMLFRVW